MPAAEDPGHDDGVVLTPEEEDELDRAVAEGDEDLRAGRVVTAEEVLARFRAA